MYKLGISLVIIAIIIRLVNRYNDKVKVARANKTDSNLESINRGTWEKLRVAAFPLLIVGSVLISKGTGELVVSWVTFGILLFWLFIYIVVVGIIATIISKITLL